MQLTVNKSPISLDSPKVTMMHTSCSSRTERHGLPLPMMPTVSLRSSAGRHPSYTMQRAIPLVGWLCSKYSYQVLEHVNIDIASVSSIEQQVSSSQQYVDFNRLLISTFGEAKDKLPIRKKIITNTTEIDKMLSIDRVVFSGEKVYACLGYGQKILVADGKNWLLNEVGLPLILALESLIGVMS